MIADKFFKKIDSSLKKELIEELKQMNYDERRSFLYNLGNEFSQLVFELELQESFKIKFDDEHK